MAGAVIQARQFAEMSHVEAEQNSVMIGSNFGSALILAQPIALAGHVVFHALAGAQAPTAAEALASCERALHDFARAIYAREGLQAQDERGN